MMHWGYRCLLSGLAGAALVSPVLAAPAARDAGVQPGAGSAQPAPSTGTSTGAGGANSAPGSYKPPAPIQPGQPISVLVFPFGFAGADGGAAPAAPAPAAPGTAVASTGLTQSQQELTSLVTAEVKAGLLSTPFFQVVTYSPNSSLIQRAQKDEIIRVEQLTGLVAPETGAVDAERARTITNRLGIQTVLLGTLDVKQDAKKNTAEITLETQLLNSTTGEVIRSAAVSGAAAGAEGVPMQSVLDRAGQEAALKLLPALGIELVHTAPAVGPTHPEKAKGNSKKGSRSDDKKKAQSDRDAERQAKKVAEEQQKADAAARKRAEQDAQKQAREAARTARNKPAATVTPAVLNTNAPAPIGQAAETAPAPAAPAHPAPAATAPTAAAGPTGSTFQGTANAAGQPIPYGYAVGDAKSALPPRRRNGIKIPAWLGVAGFLTGVSFLL